MEHLRDRVHVVSDASGPRRLFWRGRPYKIRRIEHVGSHDDAGITHCWDGDTVRHYLRLEVEPLGCRGRNRVLVVDVYVQRRTWVIWGSSNGERPASY